MSGYSKVMCSSRKWEKWNKNILSLRETFVPRIKDYQECQRLFSELVNKMGSPDKPVSLRNTCPIRFTPLSSLCDVRKDTNRTSSQWDQNLCFFCFFVCVFLSKMLNVQHSIRKLNASSYFSLLFLQEPLKKRDTFLDIKTHQMALTRLRCVRFMFRLNTVGFKFKDGLRSTYCSFNSFPISNVTAADYQCSDLASGEEGEVPA